MMPGISGAALVQRAVQGTPDWVPAGAVAYLDFVNGLYYAGGAERNIATLLGGGFDSGEISASGMLVNSANSNRPDAAGELLTDLIAAFGAGCTIVAELDTTARLDGTFISIHDPINGGFYFTDYTFDVFFNNSPDFRLKLLDSDDVNVQGLAASNLSSGIQRVGATFFRDAGGGNYQCAGSINGGTAITDTVAYLGAPVTITVVELFHISGLSGFDDNIKSHVRTLTVYGTPVTTTELAALTA